jgi:hypothetical protein
MAKKTDDLEAVRVVTEALSGFSPEEQERIIRWARERLGLASTRHIAPDMPAQPAAPPRPQECAVITPPPTSAKDLKTFVALKNPKSDIQFAATVAYFYRFEAPPEQRKKEIDATILQDACRLAGRQRFKHPAMTLNNAKNQGLLDKVSEGKYEVNTVGENLVAMTLPGEPPKATKPKKPTKKARNR